MTWFYSSANGFGDGSSIFISGDLRLSSCKAYLALFVVFCFCSTCKFTVRLQGERKNGLGFEKSIDCQYQHVAN